MKHDMPGQVPPRVEEFRRYRQAQIPQIKRWWPLVVVLLLVPLATRWLWPSRPGLSVLLVGVGFMAYGGLRWYRSTPDDRVVPTHISARVHHRAVAVGGLLLALTGVALLWML